MLRTSTKEGPLNKTPTRIRALFDEIAPTYDILNQLLSLTADLAWRRETARLACPDASSPRILDLCTGTGDLALALARRQAKVTGIDFSLNMLRRGRSKCRKVAVSLCCADALRLPFSNRAFDDCTVAFGLRNIADAGSALSEIRRVLRPGGRCVILEFIPPRHRLFRFYLESVLPRLGNLLSRSRSEAYTYLQHSVDQWYSPEALSALMQDAGFRNVHHRILFPGFAAVHTGHVMSQH